MFGHFNGLFLCLNELGALGCFSGFGGFGCFNGLDDFSGMSGLFHRRHSAVSCSKTLRTNGKCNNSHAQLSDVINKYYTVRR